VTLGALIVEDLRRAYGMKRKRSPEKTRRDNPAWTKETFARSRREGDLNLPHQRDMHAKGRELGDDTKIEWGVEAAEERRSLPHPKPFICQGSLLRVRYTI
jgi:hypothetical protein